MRRRSEYDVSVAALTGKNFVKQEQGQLLRKQELATVHFHFPIYSQSGGFHLLLHGRGMAKLLGGGLHHFGKLDRGGWLSETPRMVFYCLDEEGVVGLNTELNVELKAYAQSGAHNCNIFGGIKLPF